MCSMINLDLLEGFEGQQRVGIDELINRAGGRSCFNEDELRRAFHRQSIISGRVIGRDETGLIVDLGGKTGVIPATEVDPDRNVALDGFIGQLIDFKIAGYDSERLLLSRKAARKEKAALLLERIKAGDRLNGIVKVILPYGCFIELGGIAGLLKNREIDRRPVKAQEIFKIGQCIEVVIKEISRQGRVYLSTRDLVSRPGREEYSRFKVNSRWLGTIVTVTDFGVFVNLSPGIDALAGLPADGRVETGRRVLFKVNQVDPEESKIHGKILRFL